MSAGGLECEVVALDDADLCSGERITDMCTEAGRPAALGPFPVVRACRGMQARRKDSGTFRAGRRGTGTGESPMQRIAVSLLGLVIVAGAGQARAGGADAEGTLDRSQIREVVVAHIPEIRFCYNQALTRDPAARGRIVLDFTIGSEGAVTRSEIAESDVGDLQMSECVRLAVVAWKFPRPVGGAVQVNYPFAFEPG